MSRKDTRLATKSRRQAQTCKVYELKLVKNKLSKTTQKHLHTMFLEAKWLYNHIISTDDILHFDTKVKEVPVLTPQGKEVRKLTCISAQMKQGIQGRAFNNILALSAMKKKGLPTGKLKFKSRVHSIPLKQHNGTHTINKEKGYIKLQGIKQKLHVRGLDQLPDECEIAFGNLVKRDNDYYLLITTFVPKTEVSVPETSVGIDFGCNTQLTLSNGIKIEYQVPISKRLRRLSRRIDKKVNGEIGKNRKSKNRYKLQVKRRKEHLRITNIKKDIKNKIVNAIVSNAKYVCFQDENIHAWQASNHGKKIQTTAIGGIMSDLKLKSHTPIQVDKFFPSTQLCPQCNHKRKLSLSERTYVCYECGYINDRDVKSAIMIEREGMKNSTPVSGFAANKHEVPVERRDIKLEERASNTIFETLSKISRVRVSKVSSLSQETSAFRQM